MVQAEMTGDPTQVHPVYVELDGFLAHFFWIGPGFRLGRVFELTEHAAIALAAATRFPSSVLSFCSMAFRTFNHASIIAQDLATPRIHGSRIGPALCA